MDANPFPMLRHRRLETKRQKFRPVLRVLVEGLASLVEGQRCFAEEFGLSHGRVFHDDFEFLKSKDTRDVISEWIRDGEEGATRLRNLFDDLAQHQMALVEATEEVAKESVEMGKLSKSKLANMLGKDAKAESFKSQSKREMHQALHQRLFLTAFVAGYARSREQMKAELTGNGADLDAEAL